MPVIFPHARPTRTTACTARTLRDRNDRETQTRGNDFAAVLLSDLANGFATAIPMWSKDIGPLVELTVEIERFMIEGADAAANDR